MYTEEERYKYIEWDENDSNKEPSNMEKKMKEYLKRVIFKYVHLNSRLTTVPTLVSAFSLLSRLLQYNQDKPFSISVYVSSNYDKRQVLLLKQGLCP